MQEVIMYLILERLLSHFPFILSDRTFASQIAVLTSSISGSISFIIFFGIMLPPFTTMNCPQQQFVTKCGHKSTFSGPSFTFLEYQASTTHKYLVVGGQMKGVNNLRPVINSRSQVGICISMCEPQRKVIKKR